MKNTSTTTLPVPKNEAARLEALHSYNILDSLPEERFDNLTKLAAEICESSICVISLVDDNRQWIKSKVGLDAEETPREISFCQYTIMDAQIMEVEDATKDERFRNNPLVTSGPNIRFYAGEPLIDENGMALGTLCVIDEKPKKLNQHQQNALRILANEVTSEIEARKQRKEKQRYEKFFQMSLDLMYIGNTNGSFKLVSPSFAKLLGWSQDELMEKSYFDFIHPEDVDTTKLQLQKLSEGTPIIGFENRFRSKNEEFFTIRWTANPDEDSNTFYAVGHDVTRKVEMLEQLEGALQFQNGILNGTSIGMISTDLDGIIKSFNSGAEKLTGYTAEELINKSSPAIFHDLNEVVEMSHKLSEEYNETIEPGFDVFVYKAAKTKAPDENLWTYVNKNGSRTVVNLSVTQLTDANGKPTGYLGMASDYTEKLKFIKEIQTKNDELDQFSYVVSHDLKAPLRAINNLATWIKEDIETEDEDILKNISLMQGRVFRMENLINGILEYSKIGRENIKDESVDLNKVIANTISTLSIPPSFKISFSDQHPTLQLKKILWEQVYSNLISNALKYTRREDGIISISSEETTDNFVLSVTDNGPGIAPEYQERIFGIFQTLEARDKFESTGIGLALVKKIVDEANGTITVESDGVNGCTFIIHLPKSLA